MEILGKKRFVFFNEKNSKKVYKKKNNRFFKFDKLFKYLNSLY